VNGTVSRGALRYEALTPALPDAVLQRKTNTPDDSGKLAKGRVTENITGTTGRDTGRQFHVGERREKAGESGKEPRENGRRTRNRLNVASKNEHTRTYGTTNSDCEKIQEDELRLTVSMIFWGSIGRGRG